eukprot:2173751-Prymnesium_polylepis.1
MAHRHRPHRARAPQQNGGHPGHHDHGRHPADRRGDRARDWHFCEERQGVARVRPNQRRQACTASGLVDEHAPLHAPHGCLHLCPRPFCRLYTPPPLPFVHSPALRSLLFARWTLPPALAPFRPLDALPPALAPFRPLAATPPRPSPALGSLFARQVENRSFTGAEFFSFTPEKQKKLLVGNALSMVFSRTEPKDKQEL